jgi:predicted aldo/keto reductase-like oxidoreductase
MDPAIVAHRYALAMRGVSTVVLGVKNRQELMACLDGGGPLSMEQIALIDALGLQRP